MTGYRSCAHSQIGGPGRHEGDVSDLACHAVRAPSLFCFSCAKCASDAGGELRFACAFKKPCDCTSYTCNISLLYVFMNVPADGCRFFHVSMRL